MKNTKSQFSPINVVRQNSQGIMLARNWRVGFDKSVMKILTSLFLAALLVGCATTPREASIRVAAVQIFGSDTNLKIHEVMYAGPLSSALSSMGTSEELALWSVMEKGATQNLDLVVWSDSSSKAASTLLLALRYPGVQRLPHLRLLFVGDAQDGERVRSAVEATGASFYFHPI